MFPIALDLTKIPVLLIGQGEMLARRLQFLQEAGAKKVISRQSLVASDMADVTVVMVAGLSREESEKIAAEARAQKKLVNVEDVNDLCDFYFTANVRRGDLIIAVSTSGASPTLARKIRDKIADMFGPEWEGRVREISEQRKQWKAQGKKFHELIKHAEQFLEQKGWLDFNCHPEQSVAKPKDLMPFEKIPRKARDDRL